MKCDDLMKQLAAYLDGDTGSELCHEFEKHLASCGKCQLVVDNMKNTIKLVCQGTEAEIPAEVQTRLRQCLKQRWHEKKDKPNS